MIRIVADENIPGLAEYFSDKVILETYPGRSINAATVEDADVLLVRSVTLVNELLLKDSTVRFVATATSGTDHVDLEFLQRQEIAFSDAHGANAQAVAEYVLSMMAIFAEDDLSANLWRSVGIVGLGQVGQRLARCLCALGFKTKYYDPLLKGNPPRSEGTQSTLEEVMACDVVSVHAPLTTDGRYPTINMIGKSQLALLPQRAWFIHAARGGIVDENALATLLTARSDLRCAIDVWCGEPQLDTALAAVVDIATPHIAGYSREAKENATDMIMTDLRRYVSSAEGSALEGVFSSRVRAGNVAGQTGQVYKLERGLESLLEDVFSFKKLDREFRQTFSSAECAVLFDSLRKQVLLRRSELSSIIVENAALETHAYSSAPSLHADQRKREFDLQALELLGAATDGLKREN